MGGVECAPIIRIGFDCFNIAIMPGEACSLFISNFIRLAIRKQRDSLLFYCCLIGVRLVRNSHPWYQLPMPLPLP